MILINKVLVTTFYFIRVMYQYASIFALDRLNGETWLQMATHGYICLSSSISLVFA